jgi:hypothetical protein
MPGIKIKFEARFKFERLARPAAFPTPLSVLLASTPRIVGVSDNVLGRATEHNDVLGFIPLDNDGSIRPRRRLLGSSQRTCAWPEGLSSWLC